MSDDFVPDYTQATTRWSDDATNPLEDVKRALEAMRAPRPIIGEPLGWDRASAWLEQLGPAGSIRESEWLPETAPFPVPDALERFHAMTAWHLDLSLLPLVEEEPVVFLVANTVIAGHPHSIARLRQELRS